MVNRLIIAAAGSGKTTYLVKHAMQQSDSVLITTYTIANESEIRKKFIELNGCVPHNVTIQTWYSSDGRYAYKYIDTDGKQQFVYSWKLEKTDRLPKGKRDDLSLREKEKQIQKDLEDMISTSGGDITVQALVEKYTSQRKGMRLSTKTGYKTVLNILAKEDFGRKQIKDVRLSDAKEWLIQLQENGKGYSSIQTITGVVGPAFQMAVDDDLIRRNPFEFHLSTVVVNDSVTREASTRKQERQYLEFVKNDKHFSRYYDAIYILFHTGLRISEFCGLIKEDIDLTTFQSQDMPG